MKDEVAEWYESFDSWGVPSSCPVSCVKRAGFGLREFVGFWFCVGVVFVKLVLVNVGVHVE